MIKNYNDFIVEKKSNKWGGWINVKLDYKSADRVKRLISSLHKSPNSFDKNDPVSRIEGWEKKYVKTS